MGFKITSTRFLNELRNRVRSFEGQRVAARIRVPPSLRFWFWLEFGTALRGENPAFKRKYPIDPVDAEVLSWVGSNGRVFSMHVDHPGIRPRRFVRRVLPQIRRMMGPTIGQAMCEEGFRASVVTNTLLTEVMPAAKQKIVESLAQAAPGTRADGRLKGQSAADVFSAMASIEETSGRGATGSYAEPWMRGPQKTAWRKSQKKNTPGEQKRKPFQLIENPTRRQLENRLARQERGFKHGDFSSASRAWASWAARTGWKPKKR